jgi:uroporphyrin-III C-methyltransferase/precorrin-2 dehydrogenase/sirohydrochlorin ferrochelatase
MSGMSRLFPIFADLGERTVLVAGGGAVAERKIFALSDTGAMIRLASPAATPALRTLAKRGALEWRSRAFAEGDLNDVWLVVAATGNSALNRSIATAAQARGVFVNVVDDADLSSFHTPAVVDRHPVQVAISSGAASPGLATWIRTELEAALDDALGPLAKLLGRWRTRIRDRLPDMRARRRFVHTLLNGPVASLVRGGQQTRAEQKLAAALDGAAKATRLPGRVALVGAGPGDPGLLTLRGLRLLKQADVILHDRLVSPEVLSLARRDAKRVSVGKSPGGDGTAQEQINALMVEHAAAGDIVVRVKGGDPFIFGRGGEEAAFLRRHDIDYEIVPGITAALGCAAYAGIPLTHRDHAQSVEIATARAHDSAYVTPADKSRTLVLYMGVSGLGTLARELQKQGRAPRTPCALIENGTRATQRVITGSLERLPALGRSHSIVPPALLIVGPVAAFASRLGWFGNGPIGNEYQHRERASAT